MNRRPSEIVQQMKASGFPNNAISALLPDKTGTQDFGHEHHTKAPEGATLGGLVGCVGGAMIGWWAGAGLISLPGLGPFIAAGPILAALSGAGVGSAAGGLIGAIAGFCIPEYEAKRYNGKLDEGNILLSVHCENVGELKKAKQILKSAGAVHIRSSCEKPVKRTATVPANANLAE